MKKMKKINSLLLIGLTYFSVTLAWGMEPICPGGTCACPQDHPNSCIPCGQQGYPCSCACENCCPSKVKDFDGKLNFIYSPRPSGGFYFFCASSKEPEPIENNYRCPLTDKSLPDEEQVLEKAFRADNTAIYRIGSGIIFKCGEPPIPIQASIPGEKAMQFYICPAVTN
ncbi:MAG: hypothetical protein A2W46_05695 [Alphaproteobacteria bacterium RIFCSPHIGHO2_12_42_13]|nr:MAG: hypothetical protein A2W06_07530 [Alphaproteobacteria bacterium RBG_16_42_14]OFW91084.1 MAG: hypothetical protein A2W46_05695 [Alphaproteobacteria bacterium RIFCSPHIGHO2_12_42_13]